MKVVIFCGGKGFRLYEETEFKPKPLVTVGGKPILIHIMKNYTYYGFNQFVLCLGYRGDMIKDYFINYKAMSNDFTININDGQIEYHNPESLDNVEITLADTGLDSLTSERVKSIQKYVQGEPFMLTYGDGVSDINIRDLVRFHKSHGKIATVTQVSPISKYGVINSENGLVKSFSEKPVENSKISAGFFVFSPKVFGYLDKGMLEQTPLQMLASDNQLMAYTHDGFFYSMDTYRDYVHLNDMWNKGNVRWIH